MKTAGNTGLEGILDSLSHGDVPITLSHWPRVTVYFPRWNPPLIVTSCCGLSSVSRPASDSGEPMTKLPGSTHTQWSARSVQSAGGADRDRGAWSMAWGSVAPADSSTCVISSPPARLALSAFSSSVSPGLAQSENRFPQFGQKAETDIAPPPAPTDPSDFIRRLQFSQLNFTGILSRLRKSSS